MNSFVHLHVHSCYSHLDSASSPEQLVARAVAIGSPGLALTDANNCAGLYEFNKACEKAKIKPILGCQISVVGDMTKPEDGGVDNYVVLLAKNKKGWENLCILSSDSYTDGFYQRPRIDYALLEKHKEGLILLTGGTNGHLGNQLLFNKAEKAKLILSYYKDLFGEDLYVEIMYHPSPDNIAAQKMEQKVAQSSVELADSLGIKCVFTNDVRYAVGDETNSRSQDVLSCIKQYKTVKDETRRRLQCAEFYLKTREEAESLFPSRLDFFDNTLEVFEKIEGGLIKTGLSLLPTFIPPNNMTPKEYLVHLVYEGLKKNNLFDNPTYRARVDFEIKVFEVCGFINYFLVLHDFVSWAKSNGIAMGPGRGSAAGSLSLMCLDITKVDSIKYDLLFERFFSVDSKFMIKPSNFGLDFDIPKEMVASDVWAKVKTISESHPQFDQQRFEIEEKRLKQTKCLDDFQKIFSLSQENSASGNDNSCNSAIAFYCGLTSVAPKSEFIVPEELTAARVSPPDVDLDFDPTRRDEVFDYLKKTYGVSRVSQIGTVGCFMGKSAIRDVGKALDIGNDHEELKRQKESGEMGAAKPKRSLAMTALICESAENGKSFSDAYKESEDLRVKIAENSEYYNVCMKIDGLVRQPGIHAAGIVICKEDIKKIVPLRIVIKKDDGARMVCTQFDKDQVEAIGLYKYDCLGLKNVTTIRRTLELIKENRGQELDIDNINYEDPAVFDLLNKGYTQGVFQFETNAGARIIDLIKIDSFNDLVACSAINRPGPLKAGVGKHYSDRKMGKEPVVYSHPSMKEALSDTYGLIVYQEQIMNLSKFMAGFTKSEADKLRKAIGKKNLEIMKSMMDKFIDGCISNGISKAIAVEVWQMIEFFGEYGFNKSHSLAYTLLSFQTAYLKTYYPLEFFCALLTTEEDKDKIREYEIEAAGDNGKSIKGLVGPLRNVHINKSTDVYKVDKGLLRRPLTIVDGVGEAAVKAIIAGQPYSSFESFVDFVKGDGVSTATISGLTIAGAFDCFKLFSSDQPEEAVRIFDAIKKNDKSRKVKKDKFVSESLFSDFSVMLRN